MQSGQIVRGPFLAFLHTIIICREIPLLMVVYIPKCIPPIPLRVPSQQQFGKITTSTFMFVAGKDLAQEILCCMILI